MLQQMRWKSKESLKIMPSGNFKVTSVSAEKRVQISLRNWLEQSSEATCEFSMKKCPSNSGLGQQYLAKVLLTFISSDLTGSSRNLVFTYVTKPEEIYLPLCHHVRNFNFVLI